MRFPDVPSTSIKLMLFPFSLEAPNSPSSLAPLKGFRSEFCNFVEVLILIEIGLAHTMANVIRDTYQEYVSKLRQLISIKEIPILDLRMVCKSKSDLLEDLKGITTRSGVAYQGHAIPITSSPKVVERRTEVTKDTVFPTNNGITKDVQPPVIPVENQNLVSEPVVAPVSASMPNPKPSIPYPSRQNDDKAFVMENA
ncbi:hypothetical protein Tco_0067540 [Tanacetum coccineum]